MAKTTAAKIERPCSTCSHLHEGIKCMEDGCYCEVSTVAEIPAPAISQVISAGGEPAGGNTEGENAEPAVQSADNSSPDSGMATYDADLRDFPGNPAVLFAGDATIQGRVGEVLAAYEDLGEPVGCEITTIDDKKFKWTGSEMVEVVAKAAAPAPVPELSPEDAERLREIVGQQNPPTELPDGTLIFSIPVDVDTANILKAWADSAGEPMQAYVQKTMVMALNAVVNGGAVAG